MCEPQTSPCTCNQNPKPCHLQLLCHTWTDSTVQTGIGECAGDRERDLGWGQVPPITCTLGYCLSDEPSLLPYLQRDLTRCALEAWPTLTCLWSSMMHTAKQTAGLQKLEASWVLCWPWTWSDSAVISPLTQYRGKKENGKCRQKESSREEGYKMTSLRVLFQILRSPQLGLTKHLPPMPSVWDHSQKMLTSKRSLTKNAGGNVKSIQLFWKWQDSMYHESLEMQSI